jgi:tRNA threonylcarbamoyladenosine biosynthesis protein TsaE
VDGLFLPDEAATLALGRALASSLPEGWRSPTALLHAALGSGKTTLARGFVSALPGAAEAEVSSPSFNLANVYPTRPPVVHIDLYRLGEGFADADLEELLDEALGSPTPAARVVLVEWAEYLPAVIRPASWLEIGMAESGDGRSALLTAHGQEASEWLERTLSTYLQSCKS